MTTYRTDGPWGIGKGAPLTSPEIDTNFWDLVERIDVVEDNPATPNEIINVELIGTQLTFEMADGTIWGPFTIPSNTQYNATEVATVTGTTYTPAMADQQKYLRCTNAGGCTVIVPANASIAFPVKSEITFRQCGAGQVSFAVASGVVLNGVSGFLDKTAGEGASVMIKKVAADEWDLIGLLAPEP